MDFPNKDELVRSLKDPKIAGLIPAAEEAPTVLTSTAKFLVGLALLLEEIADTPDDVRSVAAALRSQSTAIGFAICANTEAVGEITGTPTPGSVDEVEAGAAAGGDQA